MVIWHDKAKAFTRKMNLNKDPSTSLSCTKGINNEVLSFKMWNSNTVVSWNDTYASRSGKCRHSQNEPKLRSHNITEPYL